MRKINLFKTTVLSIAVVMAALAMSTSSMASDPSSVNEDNVIHAADLEEQTELQEETQGEAQEETQREEKETETQITDEDKVKGKKEQDADLPESHDVSENLPTDTQNKQPGTTGASSITLKTTNNKKKACNPKKEKKLENNKTEERDVEEPGTEAAISKFTVDPNNYPSADISETTDAAYDFLVNELGMNHAGACGILANIQIESGFSPVALGDGNTSYGLCQWHLGRFDALLSFCNKNGLDYSTLQGQLSYMKYELENYYPNVLSYIRSVPDTAQGAYDAAYYWCMHYEIPADTVNNSVLRGNLAMNEYFSKNFSNDDESIESRIEKAWEGIVMRERISNIRNQLSAT